MQSMDLVPAIKSLDSHVLSKLLSEERNISEKLNAICLYHELVKTLNEKPKFQQEGAQLVYILSNYGIDINKQNQYGSTAFHEYMYDADYLHPDVVEAFLRCNADMFVKNEAEKSVIDRLRQRKLPKDIADICLKYLPGLWNAVETDDISAVRKLVNQWCKVNIQKEGKSILQLALEKGTEDVIRIIRGIQISVALAHGVLAGNIQYVTKLLCTKEKFNINFKNMGDRSATPLYYAACQNNTDLISLLLFHGARVDLNMSYNESDMPIYFRLMMESPVIEVSTLKMLLPIKPVPIDKMYYKGRNVLFHCVDCDIHPDIIDEILQKSSAHIVTQRIENEMTAKDYATAENCDNVVNMIDKYVSLWWYNTDYVTQKQILILQGYLDVPRMIQGPDAETLDDHALYDVNVDDYLNQIYEFHTAVEMCESETVKELLHCDNCTKLQSCLSDSRIQGKGQPALHKAVLRNDIESCKIIAESLVYQCNQRLDSVRDQYFRTALHYAFGMVGGKEMVDTLMDYGSSDFAVDKDGRSPLAFRDRQVLQEMKDLLQYQLLQDFTEPEPDPWTVRLPMPVVGYLMDCAHLGHKHLPIEMAERIAIELNPIGQYFNNHRHGHNHVHTHLHNSTNHMQIEKRHEHNHVHTHLHNSTNHMQIGQNDSQHWSNDIVQNGEHYSLLQKNIPDTDSEADDTESDVLSDEEDNQQENNQFSPSSSCSIL